MGYRITYGPGADRNRTSKARILTAVLLGSLTVGVLLHPAGRRMAWNLLLPGDPRQTALAAEELVEDLRAGQPLQNTLEAFFRNAMHGPEIS